MKTFSAGLTAAIDAGKVARIARIARTDGEVVGYTDHDKRLTVDGTAFDPVAGDIASRAVERTGASVDNQKFTLSRSKTDEQELYDGVWDDAVVELGIVAWESPTDFCWLHVYDLGPLSWNRDGIVADVMGTMRALSVPLGRTFSPRCDAILGDRWCTVDLEALKASGAVTAVTSQRWAFEDSTRAEDEHWFSDGRITWLTGENAGKTYTVEYSNGAALRLQLPALRDIAVGDTYEMTPGCDHTHETCREKFGNGVNFQGFPFLRGETQIQ